MTQRTAAVPPAGTPERDEDERRRSAGRWLLALAALALLGVAIPVIIRGAPLADEYHLCLRPVEEAGYRAYLADIWFDTGVVRPARFIELGLVSGLCQHVPFGLLIVVPLVLKLAAAGLLLGLLRDLRLASPWPEVGIALWLLEPLGTEAALWPAALHVPLGVMLALLALRAFRSDRLGWAVAATAAAYLSLEQAIFALPLAAWLVTPPDRRRRAALAAGAATAVVIAAYAAFPGENPRQALTLAERAANVVANPEWYVLFPAVGVGLHSGFMAVLWAFPASLAATVAGAAAGARFGPALLPAGAGLPRAAAFRGALALVSLAVLINLPLVVTEVGYSARTFTPTWALLAAAVAVGGSQVAWRRRRLVGALGGLFVAFAVLSLALSAWTRVQTVAFNDASADWLAARTDDGDVVAICDVHRAVVPYAPLGAFHLHLYHSESPRGVAYHTGRQLGELRRSNERHWGARCPDLDGADLVIDFDDLLQATGRR